MSATRSPLLVALVLLATVAVVSPHAMANASIQAQKTEQAVKPDAPLDLNKATAAQLEKLPGVGPATATRIVEYREKNGAFKKVEDLMNVRGIGEKTFLSLKPLVTVVPPKGNGR
jgi:comEA protein